MENTFPIYLTQMEFFEYNSKEGHTENYPSFPRTLVVRGLLFDSPSSHPDTVMTTMGKLLKGLPSFGMIYAHISIDMQLYAIAT